MTDKKKAYQKEYYLKNKESFKGKSRQWYHDHRERARTNQATWRKKNPQKHAAANRAHHIKKKFGLSRLDYNLLLEKFQRCPVCKRAWSDELRPVVDHCHDTGVTRALLCNDCNWAEGLIKTSEAALGLYEYIRSNELRRQGGN